MDFKGRVRIHSHLDIAPLIDIVFLLLVFFMLTSTFLVSEAIELKLPESKTSVASNVTPIVVRLDKTGKVALNGEDIALARLRQAITPLLAESPGTGITLKSDARADVQTLLEVMDEIRAAGGSNIGLATVQK